MQTFFFHLENNSEMLRAAVLAVKKIVAAGGQCYFVGGVVRDLLLGRPVKDVDLMTTLPAEQLLKQYPDAQSAGAAFGVWIIREGIFHFEVARAREERFYLDGRHPEKVLYTDDPAVDVKRRDFTINALLFDPVSEQVIDHVGGLNDLEHGILRTVGAPDARFQEDYLRMLRLVRFASEYRLTIEPETFRAAKSLAANCAKLAAERIHAELERMFTGQDPERALRLLDELEILPAVLPEIAREKNVTQDERFHPEGDVLEHTERMLGHMKLPDPALAWAILFHDAGKPGTWSSDARGIHFYSHEVEGAVLAEAAMNRLKFSKMKRERVTSLVRNHMRLAQAEKMRPAKLRRWMGEPDFPLELELHRIDCAACHGLMNAYVFLLDRIAENQGEVKLPEPLVRGNDLIAAGATPGPRFKEMLEEAMLLQLAGEDKQTILGKLLAGSK
ncbi:MAG: CCA tRNA nucleotidyltransferase [Victivallaceae bacterium]|nr:CCA tRNA nucleotidyltransferase [Victivallaceae bacterium]